MQALTTEVPQRFSGAQGYDAAFGLVRLWARPPALLGRFCDLRVICSYCLC